MSRLAAISLALCVGAAVGAGATLLALGSTTSTASTGRLGSASFLPPCPPLAYSADGNVSPLFCKIDNPAALKFYQPLAPHLFALGRDASPSQVVKALRADRSTIPIMCSAYLLWAWRWHWKFGIDPVESATGIPCS